MEVSAPLLPQSLATLISTVSLGARVSLRTAAIIVEALLETLQHGTSATLGISRRSLLAAVSTAKILNVLKGSSSPNDAFSMLLDKYTSLGVYVIHNSFSLAELFAISGLQLVSTTLSAGIRTAEESVRVVDGLFGSTETSRALAAIVGLVKKEVYEDQEFINTSTGRMSVLASITKALTVFACLQAATHQRTQKSIRATLLYEGTVLKQLTNQIENESMQLTKHSRASSVVDVDDEEEESSELLTDLSNVLITDPDDVTQDMTTTQIEQVLGADILRITTTTTHTTTTTQTFVRPGADLSKLGKSVPLNQQGGEIHLLPQSRPTQFNTTIDAASSSKGSSSTMAITTRSRRGSVSSIASVATTLTQYATTSLVSSPHSLSGSRHSVSTATPAPLVPSESLEAESSRQANNNLRLMFSTVTKKFKKSQQVQIGDESEGQILSRTQEREIRISGGRDSLDWSEDDTDWIEVTKSSETMSSMEINSISYDVPMEKKRSTGEKPGPTVFGIKNGLSGRKFGKSFFSKMTKQSSFGKGGERKSLDGPGPQLTITELDEPKNDSDSSLSDSTRTSPTVVQLKDEEEDDDNDDNSVPPPLPPKEPVEPNPSNFPRDHLLRNIQRFMRYASASYGHNFMRILGIGAIGDTVYSPYGDHPNHHAFAAHTSISLDSILLSSFTDPGGKGTFQAPKMHSLVHYVNFDHEAQCVVLTCRGTLGLSDVLTDLCAHYDDLVLPTFNSRAESRYKVHAGMHASARLLSTEASTVFKTVKKALEEYPDYGLVLCGHSLGGGVAAVLSLLWSTKSEDFEAHVEQVEASSDEEDEEEVFTKTQKKRQQEEKANGYRQRSRKPRIRLIYPEIMTPFVTSPGSGLPPGRPIHCYTFGPPCVMSLPLSKYCRGLVTTVVHQYDVVPTLSLGLLQDFKNVAVTLHEEGQVVEDIVKRIIIGVSSNKANIARPAANDSKVEATTFTSPNRSTPVKSTPEHSKTLPREATGPPLPKKPYSPTAKRSQSMPTYSEYDRWQLQDAEDQDWSWALIKTMRADMGSDKLYPPTPVFLLESVATSVQEPTTIDPFSNMGTAAPQPVPVPPTRSFSPTAVISAAAGAAASTLMNGLRPSSPFGWGSMSTVDTGRPSSPHGNATAKSTITTGEASKSSALPKPQPSKSAFKVSMRKFEHVEDRFGELQFARSMFTDHSPANYEACVERLCEAVFVGGR